MIHGRVPDWQRNTLRDKGRKKIEERSQGYLESFGLRGYFYGHKDEGQPGRFESVLKGKTEYACLSPVSLQNEPPN